MNHDEIHKWCRANWDKLPAMVRQDCLNELRAHVWPDLMRKWKAQHAAGQHIGDDDPFFHHGVGMQVRNLLRKQLTDEELPPAFGPNYPPEGAKNWDDFYTGALEELCETTTDPVKP